MYIVVEKALYHKTPKDNPLPKGCFQKEIYIYVLTLIKKL